MTLSEVRDRYHAAALAHGRAGEGADETELLQLRDELKQVESKRNALLSKQLAVSGFEGDGEDGAPAVVEHADEVWRDAFLSLRDAYCELWCIAYEEREEEKEEGVLSAQRVPALLTMETALHTLLDICTPRQ